MTPGAIRVDHVSRRFRVYPHEARTLKEVLLSPRRARGTDVWALRDVSFAAEPGESLGLVGRNGSGKTTLLRLVSGIIKPTSGAVAVGGRVGSLLELGAGFHPDFTGRENVYLNASVHGLGRAAVRERFDEMVAFAELEDFIDLPVRTYSSGMYMRLGFAVAAHIEADILLLDEVFAVGDEAFQRKCFGKIFEHKQRGGSIVFVSHDAVAVERLCERAVLLREGRVEFDGDTSGAMVRYHRLLAGEGDRQDGARPADWGTLEARLERVALLGPEGEPRLQFLAGEPLALEVDVVGPATLAPPRLTWELRGAAGLLVAAGVVDTDEVGWGDRDGDREGVALRFDVSSLPLAEGRFWFRLGLVQRDDGRLVHQVDPAGEFVVVPDGDTRGQVRLDGRWARKEVRAAAEVRSE